MGRCLLTASTACDACMRVRWHRRPQRLARFDSQRGSGLRRRRHFWHSSPAQRGGPARCQTDCDDQWHATPRPGFEMASSRGESAAAAASRWGNGASIPDAALLLQVLSRCALRRERVDAPALPQEAGEAECLASPPRQTGSDRLSYSILLPSWTRRLPEDPRTRCVLMPPHPHLLQQLFYSQPDY